MKHPDISGKWENQLGSVLRIKVDGTGTYKSAVGHASIRNKELEIANIVLEYPLISFTVPFPVKGSPSLTAWVGRFEEKEGELLLHTLWLLGSSKAGSKKKRGKLGVWEMFNINADTFERP